MSSNKSFLAATTNISKGFLKLAYQESLYDEIVHWAGENNPLKSTNRYLIIKSIRASIIWVDESGFLSCQTVVIKHNLQLNVFARFVFGCILHA